MIEVCRNVPLALILVIALSTNHNLNVLLALFSITQWAKHASTARTNTLKVKQDNCFTDARCAGFSQSQIIQYFCLPLNTKLWQATFPHTVINYIAIITNLDYFGLSIYPNLPSIGQTISLSQQHPNAIYMLFGRLTILLLLGSSLKSK